MNERETMTLATRLSEIFRWREAESEAEWKRRSCAEGSAFADEIRAQHGEAALGRVIEESGRMKLAQMQASRERAREAQVAYLEAVTGPPTN
jgi:hypothetical protein